VKLEKSIAASYDILLLIIVRGHMHRFTQFLQWHFQTVKDIVRLTPVWIYILPLGFMAVLLGLHYTAFQSYLSKGTSEFIAPIILTISFVISLILIKKNPHRFSKWLGIFAFILLMRELHFWGTNNGFYIGFVLLMWWASRYRETLQPYLSDKRIISLLVLIIWAYFISKTFDRHYWDAYLPTGVTNDLFEENLEMFGHVLFLGLVLFCLRLSRQKQVS